MNLVQQNNSEKRSQDQERYLPILQALADGVDPISGEIFPHDSLYQQPEVIRALFYAVSQLKVKVVKGNQGKPWTAEEDELLTQRFSEDMKTSEMAKLHGRSTGAIRARLIKLELELQ